MFIRAVAPRRLLPAASLWLLALAACPRCPTVDPPRSCEDGQRNGEETGVDCGGDCAACPVGLECTAHSDCAAGTCVDGRCAWGHCGNGAQDGDETALDCGGTCDPCPAPDPATLAPPLDDTAPSALGEGLSFLYSGDHPIQTGVDAGAMQPHRVGAVRGKVLDARDGKPLASVRVSVLGHDELGQTSTRADGSFDFAVNGGGSLTFRFSRLGYLPAQRGVQVPWNHFLQIEETRLLPAVAQVTEVLSGHPSPQVARGPRKVDTSGERQATVLFPSGTQASMRVNGASVPLSAMHLRATEYTVGDGGFQAMPGPLPPSSGYTYAVELSVDEAIAAGASTVELDRAAAFYLENFLGFPVGGTVPSAWYDRERAAWIPSENGKVVKVLAVNAGLADLDLDGSGAAASVQQLGALGVTDDERAQLGSLYPAGASLWRVPVRHFTPWDANWPIGPPPGAEEPEVGPGEGGGAKEPDCPGQGSYIACYSQVLGETIPLAGTPFSLVYRTNRTPGYTGNRELRLPISGKSLDSRLKRIEVEISIAGQKVHSTLPADPNQIFTFQWDGKDAYGRVVQGEAPVSSRIDYVYPGFYREPGGGPLAFAIPPANIGWIGPARLDSRLSTSSQASLGGLDARRALKLGGWSLSVHHLYDPFARVLYLGDAERRTTPRMEWVRTQIAGQGTLGEGGATVANNVPASSVRLNTPYSMAIAPDGTIYLSEVGGANGGDVVRKVRPDGIIEIVAGTGVRGYSGDNGPATQAQLSQPSGVALAPDGTLYIADFGNHRVRKVDAAGIITTFAGTGTEGNSGDGALAIAARLTRPTSLAVAGDGTVYLGSQDPVASGGVLRRVTPDGIITTVRADAFGRMKLAKDGTFLFATWMGPDWNGGDVRGIRADGTALSIAGTTATQCSYYPSPTMLLNGQPALSVPVRPSSAVMGPDGAIYFTDDCEHAIRRVDPTGILTTVMGNGTDVSAPLGIAQVPATRYGQASLEDLEFGPDGSLYFTSFSGLFRLSSAFPGITFGEVSVPSEDATELFVFDAKGRHLRTLEVLGGAVKYRFGYDAAGRLISVTDVDGNLTQIQRNATGDPTAIVSPDGLTTQLSVGPDGFLASAVDPAGGSVALAYSADGLLTKLTDPGGDLHQYQYGPDGRLTRDEDPSLGIQTLARTFKEGSDFEIERTSGLGRKAVYELSLSPAAIDQRRQTWSDGSQSRLSIQTDGTLVTTDADGRIETVRPAPDPVFGMRAPYPESRVTQTPGGLSFEVLATRTTTLSDPANPLSFTSLKDTFRVNGRELKSAYDVATRTLTFSTPNQRTATQLFDAKGHLVEQVSGTLPAVRYHRDSRGRLTSAQQVVGTQNRESIYGYDANGHLASYSNATGNPWKFEHDKLGRLTRVERPAGQATTMTYDARGNLLSVTPPSRPAHTFSYAAGGRIARHTAPSGAITRWSYDTDLLLSRVERPGGVTIDFTHDSGGHLTRIAAPGGARDFTFDSAGRLATLSVPGQAITQGFDGHLITSISWTGTVAANLQLTYDAGFRLSALRLGTEAAVPFEYEADSLLSRAGALYLSRDSANGRVTSTSLQGTTESTTYDSFGMISRYSASRGAVLLYEVQVSRDLAGKVTEKDENVLGTIDHYAYGYDSNGQLTMVSKNGNPVASYSYDANGNRLTGPGVTGSYDDDDRLTLYAGELYAYAAGGELASRTSAGQATTFTHGPLGGLIEVKSPTQTVQYLLDARERRIGKKVNGTLRWTLVYGAGNEPLARLAPGGQLDALFVYGEKTVPAYLLHGGRTYRMVTDLLGSPRLVVDTQDGTVAQRIDYDELGRVLLDTNPGFQPFGFAGGLYDPDTGLLRFGARDYDPKVGRWLSPDPALFGGGDSNLYLYAGNDPINQVDRHGLSGNAPDTYTVSAGALVSVGFTVDRDGNVYETGGMGQVGVSGSVGYVNPNPGSSVRDVVEGTSLGFGAGFGMTTQQTWGNTGTTYEIGVGKGGFGVVGSNSHYVGNVNDPGGVLGVVGNILFQAPGDAIANAMDFSKTDAPVGFGTRAQELQQQAGSRTNEHLWRSFRNSKRDCPPLGR